MKLLEKAKIKGSVVIEEVDPWRGGLRIKTPMGFANMSRFYFQAARERVGGSDIVAIAGWFIGKRCQLRVKHMLMNEEQHLWVMDVIHVEGLSK